MLLHLSEIGIIVSLSEEEEIDFCSSVVEVAGSDQSVAAIIARPDENDYSRSDDVFQDSPHFFRHRFAGIFHEHVRRQTCAAALLFYPAHLFRCYDFHVRPLSLML